MRGKPFLRLSQGLSYRITPADAGKTITVMCKIIIDKDHPRGCGENNVFHQLSIRAQGSPPRMRGKHDLAALDIAIYRITPADAGKTIKIIQFSFRTRDHPRGCGENNGNSANQFIFRGSPPRMRGKLNPYIFFRTYCRITPADAGKTAPLVILR